MQSTFGSSYDWAVYTKLHGRRAFSDTVTRKIKPDCIYLGPYTVLQTVQDCIWDKTK